ncbi:MAG: hypothetical protein FWF92_05050 [Oscillospiraceae bacterium]|nr:hypothetical protein [Oscillospiraceae bacterium]
MGKTNRIKKANKMYKNKDVENSRKYSERKNEIITYRLLILFGIAVCTVSFFIYAMNIAGSDIKKFEKISFAGLIITGILFIFSVVFLVYRVNQAVDESDRVIQGKSVFSVAMILFLSDLLIFFTYQLWIPFLTAFVITATALAYIYYLYQKEFFYFALFSAIGCCLLYLTGSQHLSEFFRMSFKVLLSACAVFILVFALLLIKGKGHLKSRPFKLNIKILEKNSKYFQFFILSVFISGFAAMSFFSVNINFFYQVCSLIVYFIIVGIYFTVKII